MKRYLVFLMFLLSIHSMMAQIVGSKVQLSDATGKNYTGTITEIKDGKYKVKYDGYNFEAWLDPGQFKVTTAPAPGADQQPAGGFKIGARVECDKAGIDSWEKGTVMPFLKNDNPDGKWNRVRPDAYVRGGMYPEGIPIIIERIRLLANEPGYKPEKTTVPVGKTKVDADNTLSADRPIIECPIQQTKSLNGTRPNAELCKKIIRCKKGEKAAEKGFDGAVIIDVTSIEIGTPRKWDYYRDIGSGKVGTTLVYPVKATFTYKTFYRTRTEVSENWTRIFNFYIDAFGEWAIGSEENVKSGIIKNIPVE